MWLEIMEMKVDEIEMEVTCVHKYVTKYELESSTKTLRIQNLPYEKDEIL